MDARAVAPDKCPYRTGLDRGLYHLSPLAKAAIVQAAAKRPKR